MNYVKISMALICSSFFTLYSASASGYKKLESSAALLSELSAEDFRGKNKPELFAHLDRLDQLELSAAKAKRYKKAINDFNNAIRKELHHGYRSFKTDSLNAEEQKLLQEVADSFSNYDTRVNDFAAMTREKLEDKKTLLDAAINGQIKVAKDRVVRAVLLQNNADMERTLRENAAARLIAADRGHPYTDFQSGFHGE